MGFDYAMHATLSREVEIRIHTEQKIPADHRVDESECREIVGGMTVKAIHTTLGLYPYKDGLKTVDNYLKIRSKIPALSHFEFNRDKILKVWVDNRHKHDDDVMERLMAIRAEMDKMPLLNWSERRYCD